MADMGIKAPFLNYDRLRQLAEAFIEKRHPSRGIPIPIEEIIDVGLHIDIVPIPGLTKVLSDEEDDGIEARGMEVGNDAVRLFLEKQLGDIFSVSSAVIHRRIDKEKLWSL